MKDILQKRLADIEELIDLTPEENEDRLKELREERDSVLKDIGKIEAKEEMEAEQKAAETKDEPEQGTLKAFMAEQKDKVKAPNHVKVGTPDSYKGFRMKKEIAAMTGGNYFQKGGMKKAGEYLKSNPEATERITKYMIDKIDKAYKVMSMGPMAAKAAYQVGTDSEGGYISPTEEMMDMIHLIRYTSVALPNVTVIPMSTYDMTIPKELTQPAVAYVAEEGEWTMTLSADSLQC
jgi:HK97 family phage major capsid protein